MRARLAALVLLAACGPHAAPAKSTIDEAGVTLTLYASGQTRYGVVDDRRWVDVQGSTILLDNIDPGAALASLVIETRDPAVHVGPCVRERLPELARDPLQEYSEEQARIAEERMRLRLRRRVAPNVDRVVDPRPEAERPADGPRFAPIVTCSVVGPPGRHLVRIVYVSSALRYRAQHDIEMRESARAEVSSRFAVVTPPWRQRASIVLYDGAPGTLRTPREIARGLATLDGGTSVLVVPPRSVTASMRRIFEGEAIVDENAESEEEVAPLPMSDLAEIPVVWATLELAEPDLSPGAISVHVELPGEEARWIDISASMRRARPPTDTRPLRLPLWVDDTLHASRTRKVVENDGDRVIEVFTHGINNIGAQPREVWIEETLRASKHRRVERAWPKKPIAAGADVLRHVVDVRPGKSLHVGYVVTYDQ
jgi:hypothetical protein